MAERIAEKKKRVVITGIGVISPNGIGKIKFWDALKNGISGIKKITSFDASSFPCQIAGEISDFNPLDFLEKKEARRMSRCTHFAVAAARLALDDAVFKTHLTPEVKMGIALGVSTSALDLIEKEHQAFLKSGVSAISPTSVFSASPNASATEVANSLGLSGFKQTVANDCTSGLDAVGLIFEKIKNGELSLGICGGVDAPITPLLWGGFCRSGLALNRKDNPESASRPFDLKRTAGIISEGAALLVLEEMEQALQRHAPLYGELIGYGSGSNKEVEKGMADAIQKALLQALIFPSEIDYISAHGPSHVLIDRAETDAIKNIFGLGAYRIPISSIKSMIGNPFTAAGSFQLAAVPLTFLEGVIPPTINYEYPDPACDLDYVPNKPRYNDVKVALVNSHGMAGGNVVLLVKKCLI
ncbi:MAG: beta-ketoacyl-[acyl-carrier-protein] synthase family protein [Candidatus Ratteibacteria bacterium]|jgi:3-oxoacyl-[acyl-carrier-protein] synthase II